MSPSGHPARYRYDSFPESASHAQAAEEDDDQLDIRQMLSVLWRRRLVIIGTTLFLSLLALLYTAQLTPRYTATTLLTLQTRSESVVDIQAVVSGLSADTSVINTEIEILSSRRLIEQVVDRLNLMNDPEFNPALREETFSIWQYIDPRTYLSQDWLLALGLATPAEPLNEAERLARQRSAVISNVRRALSVSNPRLSYTIEISFESHNPKTAARLANTLADIYLDDQLESKFEATERATGWLSTRITDLRQRLVAAEQAVQDYREEYSIIEAGGQGTVSDQQLSRINLELVEAKAALAEARARYQQIRSRGRAGAAALGDILRSPLIQKYSAQEAEIRGRASELSDRYGPRHPDVISVNTELRDIRRTIDLEISKISQSVENEVQVAEARVETLTESFQQIQDESTDQQGSRIQLRELEREAETSRILLETFMSRFKETSNQEALQQADARIISEAVPPGGPSYPDTKRMIIIALILSFGAGLGLAFLLEKLDNGYRTPEQLEKALRIRGLGMVPRLSALKLKGQSPSQYVIKKPASSYGEALRSVYTSLAYARAGAEKPKRLLVTSSLPGEGKSTFCLSLARALSLAGNTKVLLIECDLRRGKFGKTLFGASSNPEAAAFADYLTGQVPDWRQCLRTDAASDLAIIATSGKVEHPQTLLQSENMRRLLAEAAQSYDLVILDTPPLLAVSDALVLSHDVDATIFVVKWESTSREAVKNALSLLRKAGAPEGGALLSQVDVKKHAYYGYGDYASYYGRYGTYYTN